MSPGASHIRASVVVSFICWAATLFKLFSAYYTRRAGNWWSTHHWRVSFCFSASPAAFQRSWFTKSLASLNYKQAEEHQLGWKHNKNWSFIAEELVGRRRVSQLMCQSATDETKSDSVEACEWFGLISQLVNQRLRLFSFSSPGRHRCRLPPGWRRCSSEPAQEETHRNGRQKVESSCLSTCLPSQSRSALSPRPHAGQQRIQVDCRAGRRPPTRRRRPPSFSRTLRTAGSPVWWPASAASAGGRMKKGQ